MNKIIIIAFLFFITTGLFAANSKSLEIKFVTPLQSSQPHVFWYWLSGNISREAIDADLDAMKRVGIGGVMIYNITGYAPDGPVKLLSPEWLNLVKYAITRAGKLGIEVNLNNSMRGWSSSGGPWITPEKSMKKLTWTETRLQGRQQFNGKLTQPETVLNYYKDVAVVAFPTPKAEQLVLPTPKISSNDSLLNTSILLDGNETIPTTLNLPTKGNPQFIQFEYAEPFLAQSLRIASIHTYSISLPAGKLFISDDGKQWRPLISFTQSRRSDSHDLVFQPTKAKFWKVEFAGNSNAIITELLLSPQYRIPQWTGKAMFGWQGLNRPSFTPSSLFPDTEEAVVKLRDVVDLSSKMNNKGQLSWNVPTGDWTVLRIGQTSTGMAGLNAALPEDLECDKYDTTALNTHWQNSIMPYINDKAVNPHFQSLHIDSYEKGAQNWTTLFPEEFKSRRGYDLTSYLPIITGRVLDDMNVSERFLTDFRQVCSDLFYDNYYRHFSNLCHRYGKTFSSEAYGESQFHSPKVSTVADIPMCEFWVREPLDFRNYPSIFKQGSSAAHTQGRLIVGAEAFTSSFSTTGNYKGDPWSLKVLGDIAFCGGVNRFYYHVYTMQPWMNQAPGASLLIHGTHFERTNTWFEKMPAFNQYISRCQTILQEGKSVCDVLYFAGEATPNDHFRPEGANAMPLGYDFDICDDQTIYKRIKVQDGRLLFPDGISYRVLYLPTVREMSLKFLRRIYSMVKEGAIVIGPKPTRSISLNNYIEDNKEVKILADELWGNCDSLNVTENNFGKGKVYWGKSLKEVLTLQNINEDFKGDYKPNTVRYIHRQLADMDIYFVANSIDSKQTGNCTFRANGQKIELWDPVTGLTRELSQWKQNVDGSTSLTLEFEPRQSYFIIFKQKETATSPSSENFPKLVKISTIDGSWMLSFDPKWGGPKKVKFESLIDWTNRPENGIKYYSGTATYRKHFVLTKEQPGEKLYLDLGVVKNIASVRLNGKELGTVWCAPWRVNITEAIKFGNNDLEIEVVNLWPNRMIGDEQLPEDCEFVKKRTDGKDLIQLPYWLVNNQPRTSGRYTFCTYKFWEKDDKLLPSGLLGPVTIQMEE